MIIETKNIDSENVKSSLKPFTSQTEKQLLERIDLSLVQTDAEKCIDVDEVSDDMELFEMAKNYVYNPEKTDMLYDMRIAEEGSHLFAVMLGDKVIGEVGLRHYSDETKECELSVHMMNDSVKGKGYGTQAEKLAIDYAFDVLGAESIFAESLIKNTRSQHIMEKMGFKYFGEEEGFKQYRLEKKDRV